MLIAIKHFVNAYGVLMFIYIFDQHENQRWSYREQLKTVSKILVYIIGVNKKSEDIENADKCFTFHTVIYLRDLLYSLTKYFF